MGEFMGEFITIFIIFLFTPFFWFSVLALVAWVLLIRYLKKKVGEKARHFLTLIGTIIGVLIIIAFPLTFVMIFRFVQPIGFM